ncbi:MAG: enoyl-CoA hydratase-related protein, partial [Actinomycetota bacterium]|nr:enoyl-CoA hydratase-related protein [Actinomycetota bacterium]
MSTAVTVERADRVMIVHLDDGKANALSFEMLAALTAAVDAAEADDTVGAVVIHGRPGKFCAGFDLSVMGSGDWTAVA